jgi:1,3-beta-glucanosyltransferase GAS5
MNALAAAGIYLALDVNTPKYSINRAEPAISYNAVYLQNVFATIDVFQKYEETRSSTTMLPPLVHLTSRPPPAI